MSSVASDVDAGLVANDSMRARRALYSNNKLKLGLFGANCSSGRAITLVPERWSGSWDDNLALAQMAEAAGIEFMLPIGRWKGYGGQTDYQGTTLETLTWAAGLLAKTNKITVFGTVHAPLFHPIIAAKEFVTADLIGNGRFGLNIVVGWNFDEFEMFGVEQRDHDRRYDYANEWIRAIKRMWSPEEEFDFDGEFIKLKNVRAKPKPVGGSRPIIMNAATSDTGHIFAVNNCDALFSSASYGQFEQGAAHIRDVRARAKAAGREIDVYTTGVVTCRPTKKEAEEYYRHCIIESADWGAVDHILAMRQISAENTPNFTAVRERAANGMGGLPIIGSPDDVADVMAKLSAAGFTGIATSFLNYAKELPFFRQEVMPRLVRLGLREAVD
jgi:FMNH2-dependent dimethyl sulfone monooxygenase